MTTQPWPHHEAAVRWALDASQRGVGRGLWVMPTGTGKTRAFVSLAARMGLDTLVAVHRDVILHQVLEEFGRGWPGVPACSLPGGDDPKARVMVATVQSLVSRLGHIPASRFGLVIVDEAHHAVASTWENVLRHFRPTFRLGVTATPERLDGKGLGSVFGPALHRYPLGQAMDDGYLVKVRQQAIRTGMTLRGLKGKDARSETSVAAATTCGRTGLVVRGYLDRAAGRPALFFAADKEHARLLRQGLEESGVPAGVVLAETGPKERRETLGRFRDGALQALVARDVLTEVYDEARVSCVVMARPTCSLAFYTQAVGRGLRLDPKGGKEDCLVLDVIDNLTGCETVTAARLFGGWAEDCGGRDVRDVVREERANWGLEPLRATAKQRFRWHNVTENAWGEIPTLLGYAGGGGGQATENQVKLLRSLGFASCRDLAAVEASYLIDECDRLDRSFPTPPSEAQLATLRAAGRPTSGLTRRTAQRLIGRLMAGRR